MTDMVTVAELADEARGSQNAVRLGELANHKSASVRIAAAGNPAAADETIEHLLDDSNDVVRLACAGNLADRPLLQLIAMKSADKWMRAVLASTFTRQDDRSLPYEVQAVLAQDDFIETRQRLARTTNFADLFDALLHDHNARVRGWCAANPRITRPQMESLITDPAWEVRALTAACGLHYPDDEQLLRLARDRSAKVRWAVLFRPDRPRTAIEVIAQDTDEINRRHAQSALADSHNIMSAQVEAYARLDRKRAEKVAPFSSPPRSASEHQGSDGGGGSGGSGG